MKAMLTGIAASAKHAGQAPLILEKLLFPMPIAFATLQIPLPRADGDLCRVDPDVGPWPPPCDGVFTLDGAHQRCRLRWWSRVPGCAGPRGLAAVAPTATVALRHPAVALPTHARGTQGTRNGTSCRYIGLLQHVS